MTSSIDEDFFMGLLTDSRGRLSTGPARRDGSPPDGMTGAVISSAKLFIATLVQKGDELSVDDRRSGVLALGGRESASLNAFWQALQQFTRAKSIKRLVLRAAPQSGQFTAAPQAYKIEAALQLVPHLTVNLVSTLSIGNWVRREDLKLPSPWIGSNAKDASTQARTIETAAFAMSHIVDRRAKRTPLAG